MAGIKGAKEWEKFKNGDKLTRKQAMRAICYECNGFDEGAVDCEGTACPLYQYFHYRGKARKKEKADV